MAGERNPTDEMSDTTYPLLHFRNEIPRVCIAVRLGRFRGSCGGGLWFGRKELVTEEVKRSQHYTNREDNDVRRRSDGHGGKRG